MLCAAPSPMPAFQSLNLAISAEVVHVSAAEDLSLIPKSDEQLMVETCASVSIRNLGVLLDCTLREMRNTGMPEPAGGYTSENLKDYLSLHGLFLLEKHTELFSDKNPEASHHVSEDVEAN